MSESSLWEKLIKYAHDLWPPRLWGRTPKQGMEQVSEVTEVSNHFLGSCHIKKKAFYSSLGHSSIPVQYSSPVVQSTDSRQPSCEHWALCKQYCGILATLLSIELWLAIFALLLLQVHCIL